MLDHRPAFLAFVLWMVSTPTLADVPKESASGAIAEVSRVDSVRQKAIKFLNGEKQTEQAKRLIASTVDGYRKKGKWLPEFKSRTELPEAPTGSITAEIVSERVLKPGEQFNVKFDGTVIVPDSANRQFVVETHIIQNPSRSASVSLGRSDRPTKIRGSHGYMIQRPGEYNVLCILAVRTIKDAKVIVLDAVELSYWVVQGN